MATILAVESTAHTFGASVVKHGEPVSNVTDSYTTENGGMIPYEVADHHRSTWARVVEDAFEEASISVEEVDAVAYSQGPGIGHALRIGAAAARSIAVIHGLPIVPVNHCVAHLEIGRASCDDSDPVLLYVSGANTQVIAYDGGRYRVIGETLDMGLGNFLDRVGQEFGFGFPAGPRVEDVAAETDVYNELPYAVKGMDVSLGGLFTKVKRLYHNEGVCKEVLCHSVQETVFAMMTEVTERALSHTGKDAVVLGGGVACNQRLQSMVRSMAAERGASMSVPKTEHLVDNAAMIGVAAQPLFDADATSSVKDAAVKPRQRTDMVDIPYRD